MKREFITNLLPDIDKAVLDQIMAEHGKDIEGQKNLVTSLTTERDTLKTQIGEANEAIKGFEKLDVDGIKAKAAEWETKYNTDTQALKDQLADKEYEHTVAGAMTGLQFTSESARKAFIADLMGKKLPVQEGKLLGLDDFVKTYKESDPNAFAPEGGKVEIVTGGAKKPLADVTPEAYKKMGYVERLQIKTDNPTLFKELSGK